MVYDRYELLTDAAKIVDKLNDEMFDKGMDEQVEANAKFNIETTGYYHMITFLDIYIWDNDNEPREFIEKDNEYEDLEQFLRNQANDILIDLKKLKF